MRIVLCVFACLSIVTATFAQQWDIGLGGGISSARILHSGTTTKSTAYLNFGFMGPGTYISPYLSIKLSDRASFLFDYTLAQNTVGIKLGGNGGERSYDFITTHNFCVGYKYSFSMLANRVTLGIVGKGGILYGYNTGGGYGSRGNSTAYVQIQPMYDAATAMPPFWMPTLAAGATIGTSMGPAWLERAEVSFLLTAGLRDMFADYAKVQYKIATPSSYEEGIAQYRGAPLILSFGVKYRLFRVMRNNG